MARSKFITTKASQPCPICGRSGWCGVSEDGAVARCMKVPSAKESVGSDGTPGWIHKLDSSTPYVVDRPAKESPKLGTEELTKLAKRMYAHERADTRRRQVSSLLGVSVAALESLKVGYGADRNGDEYSSWPARDWEGHIIGIVRRYDDGSKKSWPGGSTGLFYELEWRKRPGPVLIVEGGSDTAAAITLGLPAIGRPSNTGIGRDGGIKRMLTARARSARRAIVIAEADSKPEKRGQLSTCPLDCQGCLHCFPGKRGAEMVAEQLGCRWALPPHGCKDFRDAANKGRLWPELIQVL